MRKFVALDIGGSFIKYGVLTEDAIFIEKHESMTEANQGGAHILEKVTGFIRDLQTRHDVQGICISTAGQVDSKEGVVVYASKLIPAYTGTRLKETLEATFSLPVEVENDVNCAGLAESWIGSGKGAKSLFCLTIGTGIGGSYILDNKLHTGHSFSGGEIGYIPIEGYAFEELASTRVLIERVEARTEQTGLNGKDVFEMAHAGNPIAIEEIDRLVYYLSKGIATVTYMMNPEKIIIGGGITAQKDYLYPRIMKQLAADIIPAILEKTTIEIARNLNNAGMIGALRHFLLQESMRPLRSITTIIESNHHRFTKREQLVADFIIQNLEAVPNKTITEMSRQINVSEATITRFCQKLEFGSYNKLRLLAKEATVSNRYYGPSNIDGLDDINEAYFMMMKKYESLYDQKAMNRLKEVLESTNQVVLYATDEWSPLLPAIKTKLLEFGVMTDGFSGAQAIQLSKRAIRPETLVIGLSRDGYSEEVIDGLTHAKRIGAVTIGLSTQSDSPLFSVSDVRLTVASTENANVTSIREVALFYLLDVITHTVRVEEPSSETI